MASIDKLVYVTCPICKSDSYKHLFEKERFAIVKCKNCGFVLVNPQLSPDSLSKSYNNNEISPKDYYKSTIKEDKHTFNERLELIEKYKKVGRLLDVGCNIGTLLGVANKRGWDCIGIDINRSTLETCRAKGYNVVEGPLEENTFKNSKFDVVIMSDLIEHLPYPNDTLSIVRKVMAPGGLLFIATPDVDSLFPRISGPKWIEYKPKEHLWYFSRKTIRILLSQNGFKVIKIKTAGRYRSLSILVKRISIYFPFLGCITKALAKWKVLNKVYVFLNLRDNLIIMAARVKNNSEA